jgi:hypothetical protein
VNSGHVVMAVDIALKVVTFCRSNVSLLAFLLDSPHGEIPSPPLQKSQATKATTLLRWT